MDNRIRLNNIQYLIIAEYLVTYRYGNSKIGSYFPRVQEYNLKDV